MNRLRIVTVLTVAVLSLPAHAYTPAPFQPAPAEYLALLDLFSAGTTSTDDLRPIVRGVLASKDVSVSFLPFYLAAGVHAGVVDRAALAAALDTEGCSEADSARGGLCFSLRRILSSPPPRPSAVPPSPMAREQLLSAFPVDGADLPRLGGAYLAALVTECALPLSDLISLFVDGRLPDNASLPAAEAFALFQTSCPRADNRLRAAAAVAFSIRVHEGSYAALIDVRDLPESTLASVWSTLEAYWPPLIGTSTRCLAARLRRYPNVPDRWQFLKARLVCEGLP